MLRLGRGEAATGGRQRETLLAGTLEALLGAIFFDQGLDAVRPVVRAIILPRLGSLPDQRDPKMVLQEWVQQNFPPEVPRYDLIDSRGPDHARVFRMAVSIQDEVVAEGEGSSKRRATHAAAAAAIRALRASGRM